jgi:LCP family protein required for cell wall assembly
LYACLGAALLACCGLALVGGAAFALIARYALADAAITPTAVTQTAPAPTGTAEPVTVCGAPQAMFIVLAGTDARADSYAAGLTDSMRVVRVDFITPGISYLTYQRDLYVEIPGIADHGITHGKLNQAYLYGTPSFGYFEGPNGGGGLLSETLRHNFGAQADHFVIVNLQAFVRVVDALGGLDINLPYVVDGRTNKNDHSRYFPAGPQHLDGYRTMLLARMRPEGDMQRSNTQNLILQSLAAKVLSPAVLPALPELIEVLQDSVQTDLGALEIGQLVCLAALISPDDITARNFPENLFTGTRVDDPVLGRTFVWDVDFEILRAYVEQFNRGAWPEVPPQ